MKSRLRILVALLMIYTIGCSTFKELEPDPEILAGERGYLDIKDDKENFELEKGEKYFIQFPPPPKNNFYLVLESQTTAPLGYYFTNVFDDGEGVKIEMTDEGKGTGKSVYEITTNSMHYFWVIDRVGFDMQLNAQYRYVPAWRYKFENKHADYKNILETNRVERNTYESIDENFNLRSLNFDREIDIVDTRLNTIKKMQGDLNSLSSLFPPGVANSNDEAFINWTNLRNATTDEIAFQSKYLAVLKFFYTENRTIGNTELFISETGTFLNFFNSSSDLPPRVIERAKKEIGERLDNAVGYYNKILNAKNDVDEIKFSPPLSDVRELFIETRGSAPEDFNTLMSYVATLNKEAAQLERIKEGLDEIDYKFRMENSWPNNNFYPDVLSRIETLMPLVPRGEVANYRTYRNYNCTQLMECTAATKKNQLREMQLGYDQAKLLVVEINNYRARSVYKEIIKLLNQNRNLTFLRRQYPDLDDLSLEFQRRTIQNLTIVKAYPAAEQNLINLFKDEDYLDYAGIRQKKSNIVLQLENELFESIKIGSKERVDKFVLENETTFTNVKSMYKDSVFLPAYDITFSSLGNNTLQKKRQDINGYLANMKHFDFPEAAIKSLYANFTRNISQQGVEKCRAIVDHGTFYKGKDIKVRNIIAECDINSPKWITRPKEYRRLFALPATSNRNGNNEYVFKTLLQIPSEAQFPVFDINIKLPEEVAKNASNRQWYSIIKLNSREIKNEGRIKITAPTSENDYEFQVTPVSMDKDGKNILEVRFNYPAFKVFEISVMAQKPIIKKN